MPPEQDDAGKVRDPNDVDVLAVVVPDDEPNGEDTAPGDEDPQSSEEAQKVAALMGWRPKDQWKGDPQSWKSAEDFLAEVPSVLKHTRETNSKLNSKVNRIVGELTKLTTAQRRQMNAATERAFDEALEAGDNERAKQIWKDARTSETPDEHPAFTEFKERNDWFSTNPEARAYAAALDAQFAQTAGGVPDPEKHFEKIEKAVRKRFPELFEDAPAEQPAERKGAPLVGRGARADGVRRSDVLTPQTMNREQREFCKREGIKAEDYVANYNKFHGRSAA